MPNCILGIVFYTSQLILGKYNKSCSDLINIIDYKSIGKGNLAPRVSLLPWIERGWEEETLGMRWRAEFSGVKPGIKLHCSIPATTERFLV